MNLPLLLQGYRVILIHNPNLLRMPSTRPFHIPNHFTIYLGSELICAPLRVGIDERAEHARRSSYESNLPFCSSPSRFGSQKSRTGDARSTIHPRRWHYAWSSLRPWNWLVLLWCPPIGRWKSRHSHQLCPVVPRRTRGWTWLAKHGNHPVLLAGVQIDERQSKIVNRWNSLKVVSLNKPLGSTRTGSEGRVLDLRQCSGAPTYGFCSPRAAHRFVKHLLSKPTDSSNFPYRYSTQPRPRSKNI